MIITIYKNTNFGNNDLVWNVPHPNYNFLVHERQTFPNVQVRFPLLTTTIVVDGDYDFQTAFYDYMMIDDNGVKTYYFIKTIIAERNALIFSVILDAITTHSVLSMPVSGVIVRKHDVNPNETPFDYPTALKIEPVFTEDYYYVLGYSTPTTRFIESTVNLSAPITSVNIPTADGNANIVVPSLPKPTHATTYEITTFGGSINKDETRALTLYLNDLVNTTTLNTVRGLGGDGAISDSYAIPTEAITIQATGAEVTTVTGRHLIRSVDGIGLAHVIWFPSIINPAVRGMFSISITSLQEKTKLTFPAWDLVDSVDSNGHLVFNLWCDPKPSGAPYCCPTQVKTLFPGGWGNIDSLVTTEAKSVRGGQWLKNPLIYNSARGEIFSTIETRLQRERADYEKKVSMHQLELTRREREIQIAQFDFNASVGEATGLFGVITNAATGNIGGALDAAKGVVLADLNRKFIEQSRDLQAYHLETEKQLISIAHANNLKNLDVQEQIRRVVPRDVVFAQNESMGSYEGYNGFAITFHRPDEQSLIAKDIEYTKYGYPVYETVTDFQMLNNLRQNHTVYQFEKPLIQIGGQIGDMVRVVLQSGIRILTSQYTPFNILNNPKVVA